MCAAAVSAAVASDKMIAPQPTEAARPKSGILLEKGANGMPSRQRASAIKNGRVSQACTCSPPDVPVCSKILLIYARTGCEVFAVLV